MQKEIEIGNISIAEFMGEKFKAYKDNHSYNREFSTYADCVTYIKENKLDDGYRPALGWKMGVGKYNTSWNWLMPVVEKIESTGQGYKFQICRKRVVVIEDWGQQLDVVKVKAQSKIEATWLAVVEFIKHHNHKNKSDDLRNS